MHLNTVNILILKLLSQPSVRTDFVTTEATKAAKLIEKKFLAALKPLELLVE